MGYAWNDDRLKWDPTDYEGINLTRIPIDSVWMPNIILENRYTALFFINRCFGMTSYPLCVNFKSICKSLFILPSQKSSAAIVSQWKI